MESWQSWIVGWIAVLLIYGIIDVFLVGGQKLWHRSDQVQLDQLKASLADERAEIEQLGSSLKTCSAQDDACEILLREYSSIREQHKTEIESLHLQNKRVAHLGSQAGVCVPAENDCAAQYVHYSEAVNTYNSGVSKANKLLGRLNALKPRLAACADIAKQCESSSAEYSRRVDAYNARVDDANVLAKKVGTLWYVIPVPGHGAHSRAAE